MKTLAEFTTEMQQPRAVKMVKDWHDMIPAGSRWSPGDPGRPDCKTCEGIGYLRVDLPVGHPDFGHLLLCHCVKVMPPMEPTTSNYSSKDHRDYEGVFDRGVGER